MIIERKTMNVLFYLGIIVPTIITVILFVLFIVCWYRFKARRDVLHKKHDPHGKMRQLGMIRPPPPPVFIYHQTGADNDAYMVSRSPSTEQEQGGVRPGLYHVPHDSGLSELSEHQCKDRPQSQASQGSTDSEDSGFRSSRSGQCNPNSTNNQLQDTPLMRSLKSNKSVVKSVPLSPCVTSPKTTAEWQTCAQTLNSTDRNLNSSARTFTSDRNLNCSVKNLNSSARNLSSCRALNSTALYNCETRQVDLTDISTHISWKYLQNIAASSSTAHASCTDSGPAVTTAQIHHNIVPPGVSTSVDSGGDLLGYSVV